MSQFARPSQDLSVRGFAPTPVYQQINGITPNDSKFVQAYTDGSVNVQFKVKLSNVGLPRPGPGVFRLRIKITGTFPWPLISSLKLRHHYRCLY